MPRGEVKIIHWTDPEYLNAFYGSWGSGQSVTARQQPQNAQTKEAVDRPDVPAKGTQKRTERTED